MQAVGSSWGDKPGGPGHVNMKSEQGIVKKGKKGHFSQSQLQPKTIWCY
jgi:hypothetical protein